MSEDVNSREDGRLKTDVKIEEGGGDCKGSTVND